jgi:hypothetical protein
MQEHPGSLETFAPARATCFPGKPPVRHVPRNASRRTCSKGERCEENRKRFFRGEDRCRKSAARTDQGTRTAAPCSRPVRRSSSAALARASG